MKGYTPREQEIIKLLAFLAALYPNFNLTDATIKAYVTILRDLPVDLLKAAAEDLGSKNTFFPAAAELRAAAFELAERSNAVPTAYEAWQQVKGFSGNLHPLALKAINALGGLRAFGQSNVDDEPSWRARFIAAYESYLKREQEDTRMLPEVRQVIGQLAASTSQEKVAAGISQVAARLASSNGKVTK